MKTLSVALVVTVVAALGKSALAEPPGRVVQLPAAEAQVLRAEVARARADALAALEPALAPASVQGGSRAVAALAGLGECRTQPVVERLAKALAGTLPPPEQTAALASLGRLAGSWALASEVASGKRTRAEADALARTALAAVTAVQSKDAHVLAARRLALAL